VGWGGGLYVSLVSIPFYISYLSQPNLLDLSALSRSQLHSTLLSQLLTYTRDHSLYQGSFFTPGIILYLLFYNRDHSLLSLLHQGSFFTFSSTKRIILYLLFYTSDHYLLSLLHQGSFSTSLLHEGSFFTFSLVSVIIIYLL
jgi:hypothetical protein